MTEPEIREKANLASNTIAKLSTHLNPDEERAQKAVLVGCLMDLLTQFLVDVNAIAYCALQENMRREHER